jgi:signal transduction histidine kinase
MSIDTLAPFYRARPGRSAASAVATAAPAVMAEEDLDAILRRQRLWLVRILSACIALFGIGWCLLFLAYLQSTAADDALTQVVTAHAALLGAAGAIALLRCQGGHLRQASLINLGALIAAATINLATIANAEGAGIATYGVAASVAALTLEGRAWLWFGLALAISALVGALLHAFPLIALVTLPGPLAVGSLMAAASLGVAVPAALFWVFSRDLTSSRSEAWALARSVAEANQRATSQAQALQHRTEQLQSKNTELNDFLYVVSHDLRAPLINLEGFGRTLQQSLAELGTAIDAERGPTNWPALREEIEESLDFILRSVSKMDLLARGLLDLSRLDSRPVAEQPVDLARLVGDVVASLHHTISARGIAVQVDPLPYVTGDPLRLSQVFGNLIDNAVKYMRGEGEARIHVGSQPQPDGGRFFVRDSGIGIRPEDQAKIFRLFARVGAHAVPGDGLGLTAVKKIVEQHGGSIWVESALGAGSTFWFTLPGRDAAERRAHVATPGS